MAKYRAIQQLVDVVGANLAEAGVVISENWRSDEQAVGFFLPAVPGLSAYVYTHGQKPGRFGINIDLPMPDGGPSNLVVTAAEGLPLASVVEMLLIHFDVPVKA